ncbi:hypothetical protein ANANG_G00258650 [Anguilla anguilla]|uniref:Motilin/ghrelin-associated peptide domain-containing protein n=1 Tax=Anguilla anguilla TaxID=7936 RepID=A0A9D3LRD5_ANGAN|nr:hypothetical protein ANANG_G00258650 [Anguilla anguilla]
MYKGIGILVWIFQSVRSERHRKPALEPPQPETPAQTDGRKEGRKEGRMRCTLIGALAAAFLVAALVERAESHFTFFSPKEMREMMERGRAERSEEVGGSQGKSVEIGVRLSAKQLDHVAPALGEILHEMLTETEKAK